MSRFRTGNFDRARVSGAFHPFVPAQAANSLVDVDLAKLWSLGKRLLLLDVDHTIVKWRQETFDQPILDWVAAAKKMGFDICIISNTRRVDRLARLATTLGVETVRGKFKPSTAMFRLALIKFKRKPEEAIMIGDQIFTDVLGANRSGIDAIWVHKMEGKEFSGTYISRMGERVLQGAIYRALITPVDEVAGPGDQKKPFLERAIVRQFVKFALVGGSSSIVDIGIRMVLLYVVQFNGVLLSATAGHALRTNVPMLFGWADSDSAAFFPLAATVGTAIAILNSFIWNRRWTFQIQGREGRNAELRRFVIVAVLGALWNVLISSSLNHYLPFHEKANSLIATLIATAVVMFWNFSGQRLYAFRKRTE